MGASLTVVYVRQSENPLISQVRTLGISAITHDATLSERRTWFQWSTVEEGLWIDVPTNVSIKVARLLDQELIRKYFWPERSLNRRLQYCRVFDLYCISFLFILAYMYHSHNVNQMEFKTCHRTWSEILFLLWRVASTVLSRLRYGFTNRAKQCACSKSYVHIIVVAMLRFPCVLNALWYCDQGIFRLGARHYAKEFLHPDVD